MRSRTCRQAGQERKQGEEDEEGIFTSDDEVGSIFGMASYGKMCAYLYAGALVDPLQQRLGALDGAELQVVGATSGKAQPADLPSDSCGRSGSHLGIHFVRRSLNNSSTPQNLAA